MEPKKNYGGSRPNSGRKIKIGVNAGIAVSANLQPEELAAFRNSGGGASLIRFALRKHFGLCVHGDFTFDTETGEHRCLWCDAQNPEYFTKFINKNREGADNDFPPTDEI